MQPIPPLPIMSRISRSPTSWGAAAPPSAGSVRASAGSGVSPLSKNAEGGAIVASEAPVASPSTASEASVAANSSTTRAMVQERRVSRNYTGRMPRIGTSGWHYDHWRGPFYPAGLPASRMLSHYLQFFDTVELNNTFYRLPSKPGVVV